MNGRLTSRWHARLPGVALVLFALGVARVAAHPAPFSYIDLQVSPQAIDAGIVLHIFDLGHDLDVEPIERFLDTAFTQSRLTDIAALVTSRIRMLADERALTPTISGIETIRDRQAVRVTLRYALAELPGSLVIEGTMFPYDPEHQTFINLHEGDALAQAIIDAGRTRFSYFTGSTQGRRAVIATFVPAGIEHIMIGPDHILFLAGLLLLGGSWKRLGLIVTGFTIGHSLTLSLAALNIVRPPPNLVEPAIALSIVYVGADNLLKRDGRDMRAWIAAGFGLIHGFGFASVLREMDLPARALGWSLFSFNAGVEIGQLAVVLVLASAIMLLRTRSEVAAHRLVTAGSVVVIAAGAYWFVQRLLFPGGF